MIRRVAPDEIETLSFRIIDQEAGEHPFRPAEWEIVRRLIHTTADFDFLGTTRFHPRAVAAGIGAIRSGAAVVTDTRMAQMGISPAYLQPFGVSIHCFIDDPEVSSRAKASRITRAAAGLVHARELLHRAIAVIGNSPTALLELLRLHGEDSLQPALVIGMPVGFVNAAESKNLLMASDLVYISVAGRKGGSAVAAAALNALTRLAAREEERRW